VAFSAMKVSHIFTASAHLLLAFLLFQRQFVQNFMRAGIK